MSPSPTSCAGVNRFEFGRSKTYVKVVVDNDGGSAVERWMIRPTVALRVRRHLTVHVLDPNGHAICAITARSTRAANDSDGRALSNLVTAPNVRLAVRTTDVGMISLGCAKNLVDAEIMLGSVRAHGMEITAQAEEADVLVVNTCAFIDSAKEESIEAILEAHQQRGLAKRPDQKLIVSGCMSQRFVAELRESVAGSGRVHRARSGAASSGAIVERVVNAGRATTALNLRHRARRPTFPITTRRVSGSRPSHSAYLKIAEGCNHPCSFCVIPQMRGRHRSRPPASVLAEVRGLVAEGVKEINLISQDTTYYGMDLWARESRAAPAGRFFARADALGVAARDAGNARAISGFGCSTRIRRIGATS